MEKLVITSQDLSSVSDILEGEGVLPARLEPPIKWWLKCILLLLGTCLPAACLGALLTRFLTRHSMVRVKEAWNTYFLSLLIGSGLLTSGGVVVLLFIPTLDFGLSPLSTGLGVLDKRGVFPKLPSDKDLSPQELAATLKDFVFVVSPGRSLRMASFGAGVLVAAEPAGYLIATARHVIDGDKWKTAKASEKHAMVRTTEGDIATADVVARHNDLDIALLWVKRSTNKVEFRQPIKRIGDIAVGEPVFAFGHPEGLLFSFTTGLVSSKRDGQQIQISAPTSPGSSGGSLYDSRGRLLGVVSSVFDKNREPNAENLNFAVSVEDLLNLQQWQYVRKTDRSLLEYFSLGGNVSTKKANEDQAPPRHKPN